MQRKQHAWTWQWERFRDDNEWLFAEWIWPNTMESFRGKDVLDCGCGGGQHLRFVSPYCRSAVGIDLNALSVAHTHTADLPNVTLIEADLAEMDLGRTFDIVYSIGVLHHTDDPDRTFRNLVRHCRSGGRVIIWVYSYEGNFWNRTVVEGLKSILIRYLPRRLVWVLAHVLTALLYPIIYTVYLLPLLLLPYYAYFVNWRRLPHRHNVLNVFDKLNAPTTHFIDYSRVHAWFSPEQFEDVSITSYVGVSWRASGTKK